MHAVKTDVHKMEVVPILLGNQPAHNLPLLTAHREDLVPEPVFPIGAEVLHIHGVLAYQFREPGLETCGISEVVLHCVRGEKTTDADTVDATRRIIWRHSDNDRLLPFARQV